MRAKPRSFVLQVGHEHLSRLSVVQEVNHWGHQGQPMPTPKNKEAKTSELLGHKAYASGALLLQIAKQQVLLGRYAFHSLLTMDRFKTLLPQHSRQECKALCEEGKAVS